MDYIEDLETVPWQQRDYEKDNERFKNLCTIVHQQNKKH